MMHHHHLLLTFVLIFSVATISADTSTLKPSLIRTEIRIAKSLRPEETQEINVRSNNGGFAKIVVKKRDSKTASLVPRTSAVYNVQPSMDGHGQGSYKATHLKPVPNSAPRWAPFQQTSFVNRFEEQPAAYVSTAYRFDSPKTASDNELINSFMNHIGHLETPPANGRGASHRDYVQFYKPNSIRNNDAVETKRHDLITLSRSQQNYLVPAPVFVTSHPVDFSASDENAKSKRGRSLMKIGGDGIPIVEGIRMPDDEQDKTKTWRNGRVINGELVPYEPGYVPKKAVPLVGDYGQLLFVKNTNDEQSHGRSIGPFTKSDNFKFPRSTGPFTVDDNRSAVARSDSSFEMARKTGSIGPFTVKDNSRIANSKLIDYIKTINDEESRRRDLFEARHTFKRDAFFAEPENQPKMQRRMLENAGDLVFAQSKYYSKEGEPTKGVVESSRSPVLEYAHPEFGIQAASSYTPPSSTTKPKVQYYASSAPNTPLTLQKHEYFPHSAEKYAHADYTSPYQSQFNYGGASFGIKRVKEQQPFYMRIAEQMREGVQNGFAVVLKPIVEVGQKITKNLGLGRSFGGNAGNSGKDVFVFMQNDGDVKSPEHLNSDITAGEDKIRVKRNDDLFGLGAAQLYKNDKHDEETDFIEVIDVTGNHGHLQGYGKIDRITNGNGVRSNRRKRALDRGDSDFEDLGEALLQDIESDTMENSQRFGDNIRALIQNTDWTNTQCAKKVFCEVMLQQSTDDVTLMEKKMRKFLPV